MDIVITYFVNPGMMDAYRAGQVPLSIASHEDVARHYGVSTIGLAKEVTERITAGELTWEKFGGVHPAPFGNAICAGMIDELMGRAWSEPLEQRGDGRSPDAAAAGPALLRQRPIRRSEGGIRQAGLAAGCAGVEGSEGRDAKLLHADSHALADEPGAELTLKFSGTAVGAYVVAGPDAGVVEARVDGREPTEVNLLHAFSKGLHYPRTVMLGTDLSPGPHTLMLRISPKTQGSGHAMRIMQFVAN